MPNEVVIKPAANGFIVNCDDKKYVAKTTYDLAELIHQLFKRPSKKPPLEDPPEDVAVEAEVREIPVVNAEIDF
jgi:hypothetical protein